MSLDFIVAADPQGHGEALLLTGDWVFVKFSDGHYTGLGEVTHSGDDRRCMQIVREIFERHIEGIDLTLENIQDLQKRTFFEAPDFITATAISGINQCLYDLLARRNGVGVWRLLSDEPVRTEVPVYVTINRALQGRRKDDYRDTLRQVRERGFRQFKCAPFERVTPTGDQFHQAQVGLETLRTIRSEFTELDMRIDFHTRFHLETFLQVLPEINALSPHWIEEPIELGPDYHRIRAQSRSQLAAGELCFGVEGFRPIVEGGWADVIMPDVKHVGGFGPLLEVSALAERHGVEVSPHNPSGPISTLASLHAAAVAANVTSLELAFPRDDAMGGLKELLNDGAMRLADGPGWGMDRDELLFRAL